MIKKGIVLLVSIMLVTALLLSEAEALPPYLVYTYDHLGVQKQTKWCWSVSSAQQWLWETRGIDYKGVIDNRDQARLRYQQFDNGLSVNWLGYGYQNKPALVLEAQRALAYLDYNPWSNQDGIWGSKTESAVRGFQAYNSLTVDGIVGGNTWRRLASDGRAS